MVDNKFSCLLTRHSEVLSFSLICNIFLCFFILLDSVGFCALDETTMSPSLEGVALCRWNLPFHPALLSSWPLKLCDCPSSSFHFPSLLAVEGVTRTVSVPKGCSQSTPIAGWLEARPSDSFPGMHIHTVLLDLPQEALLATGARRSGCVPWVALEDIRAPEECVGSFPGDTGEG